MIFFFLNLFQCGIYFHKSYKRRYEFIQQLKMKDQESKEVILYPSYYKIPIITSNEKNIESLVKSSSFFNSENYYSYFLLFTHFFIYYFL
jgi:hypothetical protein